MSDYPNPFIEQRADPHIWLHQDGCYYFIASVPEYDRLEIRRSRTLIGLADTPATVIWRKPDSGPMSALIWAPELHFIDNQWVIYYAAAPSQEIVDGLFQHRMYALVCEDADPLTGSWQEKGRVYTPIDSFSLDATHFSHQGKNYYLWAQKDPAIRGNSNLYLAEMANPWTLKSSPVRLSQPELAWETIGFWVNEGPAVIIRGETIFITYSASATDENYCIGLLWASVASNLLDPASWQKSAQPVFSTQRTNRQFGPGHNSFTRNEQGEDVLVYHARNYTEIEGDPLYDPNRHTRIKTFSWNEHNWPEFGEPAADNRPLLLQGRTNR
ncbi:glycoside hydrolase family 43 protein [Rosenbergiella collisarenosi]|uniref:glycoside hydrolase family 43 protein n=1 Tax=Rosenbergiella collisarenosi TaxID=1544695 RepID=UPI001BD9AC88|nr:family 43 glycosylhydrolase [Rosenbergiella collisarenosi]MBT0720466.1 family 43 glycosylhydrolase [Rosenbergiella collisarenosi]